MVAVLMVGGLHLMSLGMIGEYLGRVMRGVRNRPLYVVASEQGGEGLTPTPAKTAPAKTEEETAWTAQPMRA